jgi:hypothetical protein
VGVGVSMGGGGAVAGDAHSRCARAGPRGLCLLLRAGLDAAPLPVTG